MEQAQRIAQFYNASTDLWLDAWGDHMHHGYYGPQGDAGIGHQEAQVDMIEALLEWGLAPPRPKKIFDAGCGVGASSRYLAKKYTEAQTLGFTLSEVQAARATALNESAGLNNRCKVITRNVYDLSPEDGPFDLIWSMESAEHMGDKPQLFQTFYEALAPGGTLLMATWCHRPTPPSLDAAEEKNLAKLRRLYHLGEWISVPALAETADKVGFKNIRTDDWSDAVAPFWGAVIRESLRPTNWPGLLRSGPGTLKGAWAMRYMQRGFRRGSIVYGILAATKAATA